VEVIHIASIPVQVGTKLRQRCAWCDAILIDVDLSCMMSTSSEPYKCWSPLSLVAVDGNGKWVVKCEPEEDLPFRCCASQRKLTVVNRD